MSGYGRLPSWVLKLLADLEEHEETHPTPEDWATSGHGCVKDILDRVPDGVRAYVEGWKDGVAYQRTSDIIAEQQRGESRG